MRIGAQLRAWRELKGLNQDQAAAEIGISQASWSDLENDKFGPRTDTLVKLVKHSVLEASDLITGGSESEPSAA